MGSRTDRIWRIAFIISDVKGFAVELDWVVGETALDGRGVVRLEVRIVERVDFGNRGDGVCWAVKLELDMAGSGFVIERR